MSFITIFTATKPFTDPHINTIQRNAIQSWLHLEGVQVLLFGNEAGMAEVAAEYGIRHYPGVPCTETGAPLISAMFQTARSETDSDLLMIVNADILLMPDLLEACRQVMSLEYRFLLLSQRWDLDVREPLDFSNGWVERLKNRLDSQGVVHPPLGSDYFIVPRDCFTDIPDFAIGRSGWDNWMIYHAMEQGMPAVDISPTAMVVHQNHDYSHLPGGKPPYHMAESDRNRALAGGRKNLYLILDTNTQLVQGRLARAPMSTARLLRKIELSLYPKKGNLRGWRRLVVRRLRRMRRDIDQGA
ncbi:MAG: hypothetical protein ACM3PY_11700 [Omnitrophica WOR_2 bacterium]